MHRAFVTVLLVCTMALSGLVAATLSQRHHKKPYTSTAANYSWYWNESLSIPSALGAVLSADAFVPVPKTAGERFPVVVFPNSWGCPQYEYITRALNLAQMGYIGFEYETRGWYKSNGTIDTAGPLDRVDGSTVLDFIQAHAEEWNADMSNVAFMGISYGAGISLMMAGYDPRVKTSLVLSGWNNITYMFYGNESPNVRFLSGLFSAARKHGNPDPAYDTLLNQLENHVNMSEALSFADPRSPEMFLDVYNAKKKPLFLSSNFVDRLFRPQYMMDFFGRLQGPKFLLLNQGPHAMAEGVGIVLHDNYIWDHAYKWLGYWLRNESTGILDEPIVQMQQGTSIWSPDYIPYSDESIVKSALQLYLQPRPLAECASPGAGSAPCIGDLDADVPTETYDGVGVEFTTAGNLTTGHDLDQDAALLGIPIVQNLVQNPTTAMVFRTSALATATTICGTPSVDLTFKSSQDDWQFYTFLYDVAPTNVTSGDLLSFGFYTHYASGPTAGPDAERNPDGSVTVRGAQLHTLCRVVEAGHSLAFAVALYNDLLTPAQTSNLQLFVRYGATSRISVPVVHLPA
jgi:hypothetical protein